MMPDELFRAGAICAGLMLAAASSLAQSEGPTFADEMPRWPGATRSDLRIPDPIWASIEAHSTFPDGIGYSRQQMAQYGRDGLVLQSTLNLFADARHITRETGRVSDELLQAARSVRLGDLMHTGYALLDTPAGRGVLAPGSDTWGVSWIQPGSTPTEALEALGRHLTDPRGELLDDSPAPILDDENLARWGALPLPVQRLVVRMLIADAEARRWVRASVKPNLIRDVAVEHLRLQGVDGRTLSSGSYGFIDALAGAQELWRADSSGVGLDARPSPAARALLDGYDASMMAYGSVLYARYTAAAIDEYLAWQAQAGWTPDEREPLQGLDFDTPLGPVRILSSEDDRLAVGLEVPLTEVAREGTLSEQDGAVLVVDLGGNDRYFGRVGTPNLAGVTSNTADGLLRPIAAVVDLGGDDTYDCTTLDGGIACGIFGIGAIFDLSGNDAYLGAGASVSRAIYGTSMLVDLDGDDRYVTHGFHTQGAAHQGVALLLDVRGADQYTLDAFGQGLGGTRGAGMLIDLAGNDQYRARDNGWNIPTYRNLSASFAQGVGYGRRADFGDGLSLAGGWGLLLDEEGDDSYHATVWSQGAGYWWGVGVLEDRAGDDIYRNGWYSLGAAAHFSIGHAVDLKGSDQYNLDNPGAVGQFAGSARDGAIGILIDGDGNDRAVLRNRSGGSADLGSIGIYWDRRGNDRYSVTTDPSLGPEGALGVVVGYPEFRSFRDDLYALGLFLDTEGRDEYRPGSEQTVDRTRWDRSVSARERALGWDAEWYPDASAQANPAPSDAQE